MILDRFSKRERLFLVVTVTIIAVAIGYALILEPLSSKWRDFDRQIGQRILKLNKNLGILKREKSIKAEFAKYAEHTKSMGTDEEVIASLLKAIEQKAGQTQTRITNIRPRPVKDFGFYKEFVFEVISESSLEELLRFVYELQNSKELLKVKKLTLTLKSSQTHLLRGVMDIIKVSVK